MLKADLHVHTRYSMDCQTPPESVISRCLELGISCIVIADHGTIEGALEVQRLAPFTVVVAEEVLTPNGEIMGMFLKETIPSGLSVEETIRQIRAQGGLVNIPHPYDTVRGSVLTPRVMEGIVEHIDVIESFNARSPLLRSSSRARRFAEKHGIAQSAGSDAHTPGEIGNAYVEMPEFDGPQDFLAALGKGRICGHRTNPLRHFSSAWSKIKKRFSYRV